MESREPLGERSLRLDVATQLVSREHNPFPTTQELDDVVWCLSLLPLAVVDFQSPNWQQNPSKFQVFADDAGHGAPAWRTRMLGEIGIVPPAWGERLPEPVFEEYAHEIDAQALFSAEQSFVSRWLEEQGNPATPDYWKPEGQMDRGAADPNPAVAARTEALSEAWAGTFVLYHLGHHGSFRGVTSIDQFPRFADYWRNHSPEWQNLRPILEELAQDIAVAPSALSTIPKKGDADIQAWRDVVASAAEEIGAVNVVIEHQPRIPMFVVKASIGEVTLAIEIMDQAPKRRHDCDDVQSFNRLVKIRSIDGNSFGERRAALRALERMAVRLGAQEVQRTAPPDPTFWTYVGYSVVGQSWTTPQRAE